MNLLHLLMRSATAEEAAEPYIIVKPEARFYKAVIK